MDKPIKWRNTTVMIRRLRLVNGEKLHDIRKDPGQWHGVAATTREVVRKLRDEYDTFWSSVSGRFDEPARNVVGADEQTPTNFTCRDLRAKQRGSLSWKQRLMNDGVAEAGTA